MTTHPLTGKRYPARFYDVEAVDSLLLLVDISVPDEKLKAWPDADLQAAGDWALRVHLEASDNVFVRVPPKPECVKRDGEKPDYERNGTVMDLAPLKPRAGGKSLVGMTIPERETVR